MLGTNRDSVKKAKAGEDLQSGVEVCEVACLAACAVACYRLADTRTSVNSLCTVLNVLSAVAVRLVSYARVFLYVPFPVLPATQSYVFHALPNCRRRPPGRE